MISQYPHPIPLVRPHNSSGWRTEGTVGEGLVWLVEVVEPDPREGTKDVYVVADNVEVNDGRLELSLKSRPQEFGAGNAPVLFVRVFAPGVWREYHLVAEAPAIAQHTAEMFKEDDDD